LRPPVENEANYVETAKENFDAHQGQLQNIDCMSERNRARDLIKHQREKPRLHTGAIFFTRPDRSFLAKAA
jgi:hypothetical protein